MKYHKNVWITGLTSFFTDVSSEMIYPLISLYLKALGGGPEILGLVEGIAESTASLLKVLSGALADRVGKRKPLAILGYSLSLLGKFILFLAGNWVFILVGRFIDRTGKGTRGAPRDAMIAESVSEERRGGAYGIHRTLDTAGAVLGVLGSYFIITTLIHNSSVTNLLLYKKIILFSLIPAAIGVLILFFSVETGSRRKSEWSQIGNFRELNNELKIFLGIIFFFTLGNSSNQFIFLRAVEKDLSFSVGEIILLYLLFNIVEVIISYPAGWLSDKINKKFIIATGFFAYGVTYLIIALFPHWIWVAMAIYGIYTGTTQGVTRAFVSILSPPDKKATTLGLYSTIEGIGLLPASLLAGFLWQTYGHSAPFFIGALTGLLSSFFIIFFIRKPS